MAITAIAACATDDAVDASASTEFTVTSAFTLYADNFEIGENAILYRLGPSGNYYPATNQKGAIVVSALPNMASVESGGTFRIKKDATKSASVSVGYEEQL